MSKRNEEGSEFLHYDECNLDREWRKQAPLFHEYARKLADAKFRVAEAKTALDVVEAELVLAIRATPERFGLDKTTDKLVEAAVKVQPERQRAAKKLNEVKHEQDVLQAVCDALHHKKAGLENAVILWSKSYFAEPAVRGEVSERAKEKFQAEVERRPYDRTRAALNRNRGADE